MQNELINVREENGRQLVSARDLHKGLEATERFGNWFERYVIKYGFIENQDYLGCKVFNTLAKQELQDYVITLDVAKHVAMIQRNELGMKFRQYFIECEKKLKEISVPSYMISDSIQRAERWIEEEKVRQQLALELKEVQPKVEKFDKLMDTDFTYTPTQMAKCYGVSSASKLNKMMNEKRICYKQGKSWLPYSGLNEEWYKVVVNEFGSQLRFTSKGVVDIADLLELDIDEEKLN